jgi:hypothetical protein
LKTFPIMGGTKGRRQKAEDRSGREAKDSDLRRAWQADAIY